VEQFLTAYGVQGGVITYEDGSSARFSELDSAEQEILSSLVSESVPSIEKYNLDETRYSTHCDSDMTSEEFINLVDYRMQTVSAQRELSTTDYEAYLTSLRDSYPNY
jgi:hypothetical protein